MNTLLALKLFLIPAFVLLISYIQKRWGHGIGGKLLGFPIITGPFLLIIYLQEGRTYAAAAAHGVLMGQIVLMTFLWSYSKTALLMAWAPALATATLLNLLLGFFLSSFAISLPLTLILLTLTWAGAMKFWPKYSSPPMESERPRWELPVRMLASVGLILILTGLADALGARISGALSTYPVIISVLGSSNHRRSGSDALLATTHGLLKTLPLAIGFTLIVAVTL
ncbi:MAG: hypothetical protein HY050_09620 [Actinobacteria bacterium]|nr:hypothetical protein [Actinomycetota bacterium]